MSAQEWQFDGIVGPTHNYAGLAQGNLASSYNKGNVSNPRAAALQGLEKMRFVRDLGMPQAFLPPHYRPHLPELRRLGFSGNNAEIIHKAYKNAPALLASAYSSSFMWAANAATVTSYVDSADGKLHLTTANLCSHYHRAIEADFQFKLLKTIFHNKNLFSVNNYLIPCTEFGDEGAANHAVINKNFDKNGFHIFVYGKSHQMTSNLPKKHIARQNYAASVSIARLHGIALERCLFLQQSPEAIDAGVFHNDVIAMNTTSRMIVHEQAYISADQKRLRDFFRSYPEFSLYEVTSSDLTVEEAVSTYLFNSQMLMLPTGRFVLVAPTECDNNKRVAATINKLTSEGMLDGVHYIDVHQSMKNGGGPACLRLKMVMSSEQSCAMHQGIVLTDAKYTKMKEWINTHYRDRLSFDDFSDPNLIKELDVAYSALETILDMPGLYDPFRQ